MIFKPRFRFHPPQGRVDGVIYYGASVVAQDFEPVGFDKATPGLFYWDGTDWIPVTAVAAPPLHGEFQMLIPPDTIFTVTAAGVLAGAHVTVCIKADEGDDAFDNAVVRVGDARDGEFDCLWWGVGFDSATYVVWTAWNL